MEGENENDEVKVDTEGEEAMEEYDVEEFYVKYKNL